MSMLNAFMIKFIGTYAEHDSIDARTVGKT